MKNSRNLLLNITAVLVGLFIVCLLLFGIEMGLRFKYNDPAKLFFSLDPKLLNHVALFRRSNVPSKNDPAPRVFCLGGSTTNGNNMPIPKSYPNILGYMYSAENKKGTVYNFGISGVSSVTTNFFTKNIVSRYDPGCIVLHDGYNDLPIIIKKLGEDRYSFIKPDYNNPFNPYIKNPISRYFMSFIKFNLRATRRFVVTFVKDRLHKGGDLFLGFDYKKYKLLEGSSYDIYGENRERIKIMLKTEADTIDYCLRNGIKVIVILEPHIKPYHYVYPFKTGFRDENVGPILSECHKRQQRAYAALLIKKYKGNPNVVVLDMRDAFKGRYKELFYDECHLNGKGNTTKALIVYQTLLKLFPEQ